MIIKLRCTRISFVLMLSLLTWYSSAFGAKETFNTDIAGMQKLTIYGSLEHHPEGGNSGGYLRFDGQDKFGVFTQAEAFTGDYAAQGHEQIACDLTVFLFQMTAFKPQFVIRAGPASPIWYYTLSTFEPIANEWRHYAAQIDPLWTDTEAMAHGWQRDPGQETSFAETLRQVRQVGLRVKYTPITSAVLGLDNFYLGKTPAAPQDRVKLHTAPLPTTPKSIPKVKRY